MNIEQHKQEIQATKLPDDLIFTPPFNFGNYDPEKALQIGLRYTDLILKFPQIENINYDAENVFEEAADTIINNNKTLYDYTFGYDAAEPDKYKKYNNLIEKSHLPMIGSPFIRDVLQYKNIEYILWFNDNYWDHDINEFPMHFDAEDIESEDFEEQFYERAEDTLHKLLLHKLNQALDEDSATPWTINENEEDEDEDEDEQEEEHESLVELWLRFAPYQLQEELGDNNPYKPGTLNTQQAEELYKTFCHLLWADIVYTYPQEWDINEYIDPFYI